jgi:hypothetical protein
MIESHQAGGAGRQTAAHAAAAACDGLYRDLSRWVGRDGCHALFTRARAEALTEHPALAQVQLGAQSELYVEGVAEAISAHGDDATARAIETMLLRVVELLSRLIGDDMATKLIGRSVAASGPDDATSASGRKETRWPKSDR